MKKNIKYILLITGTSILAVIIFVTILIHIFGDQALKVGIEFAVTKALGVNAKLEKISFSVLGGNASLNELIIYNPKDYQHETFLKLGKADIDMKIKSLLDDTVEIETLKFDNINLVIEQKGTMNNLQEILSNLPKSTKENKQKASGKEKKLHIDLLEITNINVKFKLLPVPGKVDTFTISLVPIKMTNLGYDNKMSTMELTKILLSKISESIVKEGPSEYTASIKNTLKEQGKTFVETGKKVLRKTTNIGLDVLDKSNDVGKGLGDTLKGLIKGKEDE